jgi:hypothetical protein
MTQPIPWSRPPYSTKKAITLYLEVASVHRCEYVDNTVRRYGPDRMYDYAVVMGTRQPIASGGVPVRTKVHRNEANYGYFLQDLSARLDTSACGGFFRQVPM